MVIFWLLFAASALVLFVGDFLVWLFTFWWDKRLVLLHRYSIFWAHFCLALSPAWRLDVAGRQNADKNKVYVIVCNHQSLFDILVLYSIRLHFKWVAKKELAKVPVIGWNLYLNKYMLIDRKSFSGSKKMQVDGMKNLKMGNSLLIFSEGTRSPDGKVKRFKDGAFVLAKNAQVSILPVVIDGTRNVFYNTWMVNFSQTFKVRILPEIPYSAFKDMPVAELSSMVNVIIEEEHKKLAPELYC